MLAYSEIPEPINTAEGLLHSDDGHLKIHRRRQTVPGGSNDIQKAGPQPHKEIAERASKLPNKYKDQGMIDIDSGNIIP